jgi:hypothetical protein
LTYKAGDYEIDLAYQPAARWLHHVSGKPWPAAALGYLVRALKAVGALRHAE